MTRKPLFETVMECKCASLSGSPVVFILESLDLSPPNHRVRVLPGRDEGGDTGREAKVNLLMRKRRKRRRRLLFRPPIRLHSLSEMTTI